MLIVGEVCLGLPFSNIATKTGEETGRYEGSWGGILEPFEPRRPDKSFLKNFAQTTIDATLSTPAPPTSPLNIHSYVGVAGVCRIC